jgi:hypothetical protein
MMAVAVTAATRSTSIPERARRMQERDAKREGNGGASLGCSRQLLANDVSFDHLVGAGDQRRWDVETKGFGRLQVNDKFKLGRLHYGHGSLSGKGGFYLTN